MKKLNKVAVLFASAAIATAASAQIKAADGGNTINNWQNGNGELVWKNGSNELCWRDASWTPATAAVGCDGALVVAQKAEPAPAPAPAPEPELVVTTEKVTFAADTFFDFDKATLKPEGRAKLDELAAAVKAEKFQLEVIVAVGYTDSTGPDAYNLKLSERRAAAVKSYLVSQGIEANRIYTEGKGKADPIATNATREGRAQNRRVEIEVTGSSTTTAVQR